MNYKIADLHGNPEYNLKGIRLRNGKSCVYWTNKTVKRIDEVIVIYNNNNIRPINNNQICISLNGINDIQTQKEFLKAFCDQLRVMGVNTKKIEFKFIIADNKMKELADEVIKSLGINGSVLNFDNESKKIKGNDELSEKNKKIGNKIDNKLKGVKDVVGDSNISLINKDNKKIVVDKDKNIAYDMSYNTLSIPELMKAKYEELMKDPVEAERLFNMSDEEVIRYISYLVTEKNKKYNMESNATVNKDKMTKVEKATADVAAKYDGVSNNELGITHNSSKYTEHEFSVTEEKSDNSIKIVNPESSSIGMTNNNSSSSSNTDVDNDALFNSTNFTEMDEQEKEEDNVVLYYVDSDGRVYDGNTTDIVLGLYCDENNKIVDKDGKVYGFCNGNLNDMYNNIDKKRENERAKTRVYRKIDNNKNSDVDKNAAFISLPVIIFIISLLLLISSGIIWFMTK